MKEHNSVYLAWQSPESRDWHVVGALFETNRGYEFRYTKGALVSDKFVPFSGMDDLYKSYISEELFPLFRNRILSNKRPEYPKFIKWLGLEQEGITPVDILARSGAQRGTDQLQMFQKISVSETGDYEHYFFAHGLSHLTRSANKRVESLEKGEKLRLCLDCQNAYDQEAVLIRADNPAEILGYCPRYLAKDISLLLKNSEYLDVFVEMSSEDAPTSYKLMCKVVGRVDLSKYYYTLDDEYKFTF